MADGKMMAGAMEGDGLHRGKPMCLPGAVAEAAPAVTIPGEAGDCPMGFTAIQREPAGSVGFSRARVGFGVGMYRPSVVEVQTGEYAAVGMVGMTFTVRVVDVVVPRAVFEESAQGQAAGWRFSADGTAGDQGNAVGVDARSGVAAGVLAVWRLTKASELGVVPLAMLSLRRDSGRCWLAG
jgi:hypothetical protein